MDDYFCMQIDEQINFFFPYFLLLFNSYAYFKVLTGKNHKTRFWILIIIILQQRKTNLKIYREDGELIIFLVHFKLCGML